MRTKIFFSFSLIALLFISCAKPKVGYGILLWSDKTNLKNGSYVFVQHESKLKNSYIIKDLNTKKTYEISQYRVRVFKKKKEAMKFKNKFHEYISTYALTEKIGLPIRERPDSNSKRIYRMKEDQIIKIVGRNIKAKEGEYENYWYEVLTDDGVSGYCFGYALKIFVAKTIHFTASEIDNTENELSEIFKITWRPEYYSRMIEANTIALERFNPDIGLYFDKNSKEIKIVHTEGPITLYYTGISKSNNLYLFDNSGFNLEILSENEISINYFYLGKSFAERYVKVEEDLNALIKSEMERRSRIYSDFLARGNKLSSQEFGTIYLKENFSFSWNNYNRLVPNVIPNSAGNHGKIEFAYFLADNLKSIYDGIITFDFYRAKKDRRVSFLYNINNTGIKLLFIPEEKIIENIAEEEPASSQTIFFNPILE